MKTYVIVGAVLIAGIAAMFWFGGASTKSGGTDGLVPVSGFDHAHGMALDPADASKLYIATHNGLFLLKNDAELYRVGASQDDLMGFSAHPTESGTFFSSGHPAQGGNIGFQKSTDGGITWKQVSPGLGGPVDFHAMAVSAIDPDTIYGFYGGRLQRSVDGGEKWEYAKGSIAPISLTADPERERVLYAPGQNGVSVSEDGGDSWRSLSSELEGGAVSVIAFDPSEPAYALAYAQSQGGLGKSADSGATWKKVDESFGGGTVLYLAYSKVAPGLVYALTHQNSLFKSRDGGDTWQKIR